MNDPPRLRLAAYATGESQGVSIVPAPIQRDWMNDTHKRFANRCLPILLSNQNGWLILSGQRIDLWWTGFSRPSDLRIRFLRGEAPCLAESHFGYGIATWKIPFLFRTEPGYDLLVRGPPNYPKDGIYPLEGLVEADWASASFTMNWKITRRFKKISFDVGEPICILVPQRRGELEKFSPSVERLSDNPILEAEHLAWSKSRKQFNTDLKHGNTQTDWQKHYFTGHHVGSCEHFNNHQRRLDLAPFLDMSHQSKAQDV